MIIQHLSKKTEQPIIVLSPTVIEEKPKEIDIAELQRIIKEPIPDLPHMPEKIYNFAKESLGKDIAATQNELGCAEAVSYVLNQVRVPGFPSHGFLGTEEMWNWLIVNAWKIDSEMDAKPGDIIISPTGTSIKNAQHGHVGIVAKFGILSNNSMNGLWEETYTISTWYDYYGKKLGFPVYFYRIA